ncbi:MAG: serine/threonine-protein phosphatase [Verrucomicrobiota bacterium]|nr:serine/threonine-protein phosphatase [Verrucomicrobiota bacterium]
MLYRELDEKQLQMTTGKSPAGRSQMTRDVPDAAYRAMRGPIGHAALAELWNAPWDSAFSKIIPEIGVAFGGHPGLHRARNEDRAVVAEISLPGEGSFTAALICDGVGGSEMGDIAATLAVATILDELSRPRPGVLLEALLVDAFRKADDVIRNELRGGGTTTATVILVSSTGRVAAANVGDSRIYAWRPGGSEFRQVSVDDTIENELRDLPVGDPSVLDAHGLRGRLSQALGESHRSSSDLRVIVFSSKDFERGAILASDGAWRGSEDGFRAIALHSENASDATRRMLAFARWAGGLDNISVIAIQDIAELALNMKQNRRPERSARAVMWICESKIVASAFGLHGSDALFYPASPPSRTKSTETRRKKKKWGIYKKDKETDKEAHLNIDDGRDVVRPLEPRPKVEISVEEEAPPPQ